MILNDASVVDGDVERKVVYMEQGAGGGGFGRGGLGGGGPAGLAGLGGGNNYKTFSPSHPQAVNQYVGQYNFRDEQQQRQPKYDYGRALQLYNEAVNRKYSVIRKSDHK